MKWLGWLAVLLAVLIGLTPLWAWLGGLVYSTFDVLGHLGARPSISDGRAAFRAAVMLGGTASVLSLLRVAWLDRSGDYLVAALMLGLGFVVVVVISGRGGSVDRDAPRQVYIAANDLARGQRQWSSREAFEQDSLQTVEAAMRAGARGDVAQVDHLLSELKASARLWPRTSDHTREFARLRDQYSAVVGKMNALSPPSRTGAIDRSVLEARRSPEYRALDAESTELLRQMWAASPRRPAIALALLTEDMRALSVRSFFGRRQLPPALDELPLQERLYRIQTLLEQVLAYAPNEVPVWEAYSEVMADQDEELALGARVVAGQLERRLRSGVDSRDYLNTGNILLGSDVRLGAIMMSRGSRERSRILEARASALLGPAADKVSEGTSDDAGGDTAASPGGMAEPGLQVVSVTSPSDEPDAERALPPRGTLADGTGLWVPPRPRAPAAPAQEDGGPPNTAEGDRGTLRVDLAAAGFTPEPLPPLPEGTVVARNVRMLLVVDVWEDGQVTSVLVQRSSGVLALDQAARAAAARWRSAVKVPAGGERRGVAVEFLPSGGEPPVLR